MSATGERFLLELRGVHKAFGRKSVLRGVDLGIRDGETFTILGGSGSGKSVCLKHLIGLLRPDAGRVLVDGRDPEVPGHKAGNFVAPTVLGDVDPDAPIARTEVFGPVLSLLQVDDVDEASADADVVRPAHWGGYALRPHRVELWQGRDGRLHDRFRFERDGDAWRVERLGP